MDKKVKTNESDQTDTTLMHQVQPKENRLISQKILLIFVFVLLLGIGSGYLLAKRGGVSTIGTVGDNSQVSKGVTVGSNDTKTFKDKAEGVLQEGGIEGEGQYHLVRPGGVSQNVYLTSSTVDLSLFMKKKVKVWGETQKAQTAGWLMDVGRVEVLD